ncbi:MAG: hypothetical protein AXA67_13935 [Methylothermaceae bacteria B42]|nr:MAG: hypothetical protein AXA67_13935 [Methylothermaceae bacteria B42]HHJ38275.1 DUF4404 family protein [Methylothermaceae bacterium]
MTEREKLREGLEALRSEIKNLQGTDAASKQRLEDLAERVEKQLAKTGEKNEHHNLIQELEEEIMRFEVAHPRLTAIINDLMVTLSNMGI